MTISLKSDASGNSGAIQVAGVDRLTLNTDGSLVAGANPATGTRSMALATMQKFADEFGASLAGNGYQKLPSGLIIQWGEFTFTGTHATNYSTTFPVTFPSSCAQLTTASNNTAGTLVTSIITPFVSKTPSGFTVQYGAVDGGSYSTTVQYVAIGY